MNFPEAWDHIIKYAPRRDINVRDLEFAVFCDKSFNIKVLHLTEDRKKQLLTDLENNDIKKTFVGTYDVMVTQEQFLDDVEYTWSSLQ